MMAHVHWLEKHLTELWKKQANHQKHSSDQTVFHTESFWKFSFSIHGKTYSLEEASMNSSTYLGTC